MRYITAVLYEEIKQQGVKVGSFLTIKHKGKKEIFGSKPNTTAYTYKGLQIYEKNHRIIVQNHKECDKKNPTHLTDNELETYFFDGLEKGVKLFRKHEIKQRKLIEKKEYERLKLKYDENKN